MSLRPWSLDGFPKKAAKAGYTPGTDAYANYFETNRAKAHNSFLVPCIAGYIILASFSFVVLIATVRRVYINIRPHHAGKFGRLFDAHLAKVPFLGNRYARAYGSGLASIRMPLRGQAILLLGLAMMNFLPSFVDYRILDPARNTSWPHDRYATVIRYAGDRAAVLAVAQIPLLFLLSGRNSLVSLLTGCSFHTTMVYHRWIGRIVVLQAMLHGILYTAYLVHLGKYKHYWTSELYFPFGVTALTVLVMTAVLAHRPILREWAYDVFVVVHVIMAMAALVLLHYHLVLIDSVAYRDFVVCTYVAAAFWAFDRLVRLMRLAWCNVGLGGSCTSGVVSRVADTDILRLTVRPPATRFKRAHRSGMHYYLYLPFLQPFTSHPFSLTEVRHVDGDQERSSLIFYARIRNGITQRLASFTALDRPLTILLEGPYGKQHDPALYNSPSLLLVASGIGITHCLSIMDEMLQRPASPNGRNIQLIWCIRTSSMMRVADDMLQRLRVRTDGVAHRVSITVFVARSSRAGVRDSTISTTAVEWEPSKLNEKTTVDEPMNEKAASSALPAFRIRVQHGKADVTRVVHDEADEQTSVIACGSARFLDEVRAASLSGKGVAAYVEEPFGW